MIPLLFNWLKTHKNVMKVLAILIGLLSAFAWGRFSAPSKVVTKTEIQTKVVTQIQTQIQYKDRVVTKVVYQKAKAVQTHSKTVTQEVINSNGQKIITTTTTHDTNSDTTINKNSSQTNQVASNTTQNVQQIATKSVSKEKTITYSKPDWQFTVLGGMNWSGLSLSKSLSAQPWLLGGEIDRRIIGPLYLGGWGLSNGSAGLAASLQF